MALRGSFLVTLATLMLEVLDTRLLSVLTWYHLSFLAVSVAMLGMAAGAVLVFVGGDLFAPERRRGCCRQRRSRSRVALPVSHVANLAIPFPSVRGGRAAGVAALGDCDARADDPVRAVGPRRHPRADAHGGADRHARTAPTARRGGRVPGDHLAARADRHHVDGVGRAGAAGDRRRVLRPATPARAASRRSALAVVLFGAAASPTPRRTGRSACIYPKSRSLWMDDRAIEYSAWNAHSNVTVRTPGAGPAFLWGAGGERARGAGDDGLAAIDGDAGTAITQWDGDPASLELGAVRRHVAAVSAPPRRVAVIGVGGGRDVLTAICGGQSVDHRHRDQRGVARRASGPYRDFARIADHRA